MPLRSIVILIALTSARIAFGYQFQTIGALATDLVARFGLTYTQLGTLIGTYMVMGAFVALPLGLLGRRFGEGLVMSIGLALMTGGAGVSALATSALVIGAGRAVAGVGAVAMIVLQNKIIAEWFKGGWFMAAISITVCAFPVGMGLAGLVLPAMQQHVGLGAALATDSVPAGVALLLFVASYREPPFAAPIPRRFSLPSASECLLLAIAGLTWMAYTAGFSGFVSYLPSALSLRGYGLPLIGAVMAIATWGNVVGTLAGGGLSVRLGGMLVFVAGTCFIVAGMLALTATDMPIAGALVFGILGAIQPGVLMAAGTLSARAENRAVGMGLFYTIYYAGGAVVPALCGYAADIAGRPDGALYAATALSVLAIPTFMLHRALATRRSVLVNA